MAAQNKDLSNSPSRVSDRSRRESGEGETMLGPAQIETRSGKVLDLIAPEPASICIEDIAHALSMQCRYNGHCERFISVAEHSWLVADWLKQHGAGLRMELLGLLHDAPEAYLGDLVHPVKTMLPAFKILEAKVAQAIYYGLEIGAPTDAEERLIKRADIVLLATEARSQMSSGGGNWGLSERPDSGIVFSWWQPHAACVAFLEAFQRLTDRATAGAPTRAVK